MSNSIKSKYRKAVNRLNSTNIKLRQLLTKKTNLEHEIELLKLAYIKEKYGFELNDVLITKSPGSGVGAVVFTRIYEHVDRIDPLIVCCGFNSSGINYNSGLVLPPSELEWYGKYDLESNEIIKDPTSDTQKTA